MMPAPDWLWPPIPKKLIPEPVWGEAEKHGADSELRLVKQQWLQSCFWSR
jgi:hypothetical protein